MQAHRDTIIQPDWKEWPRILGDNKRKLEVIQEVFTFCNVFKLKDEILQGAKSYTEGIYAKAELSLKPSPGLRYSEDLHLIMTGHQPIVYHSGIMFKQQSLSRFASDLRNAGQKVQGINILIDTDLGDAGEFCIPSLRGYEAELVTIRATSKKVDEIFKGQQLASEGELLALFEKTQKSLQAHQCLDRVNGVIKAQELYLHCRKKEIELPAANFLVRHAFEESVDYLELPFSSLIKMPESLQIFERILLEPEHLHREYNHLLGSYRTLRKIKNKANPFPDLRLLEDQLELPFWLLKKDNTAKLPLFARKAKDKSVELLCSGKVVGAIEGGKLFLQDVYLLVPRAMFLTLFLRYFCSDAFIHGLGGASYDKFTDYFASSYLKLQPPDFMVASKSRYLFQRELVELKKQKDAQELIRDILSSPEKLAQHYPGCPDPQVVQQVAAYAQDQSGLIKQLEYKKKNRLSASNEGMALTELKASMKSFLEERLPDAKATFSPEIEEKLLNRNFPFFMFG
jgi:hypothetical protein